MSEFMNKISQSFDTMTHSQKKVANYVMENLENIAFYTLENVAANIGVSTTTVIRFTRKLGYEGYGDMQKDVQQNLRTKVSLPERFYDAVNLPKDQLLKDSFAKDMKNIQDTLSALSEETLKQAVDMVSSANRVYVLGMRSSFSLAFYMASRLGQIKKNVHLIETVGMMYPEEIVSAEEGDVCIAYLFPRYSKTSTTIISWLKKSGVKVILFSSFSDTAVHGYGDILLPCYVSGLLLKNSYTAPLCLTNYLTNALILLDQEGARETLERTEEILSQGFYLGI